MRRWHPKLLFFPIVAISSHAMAAQPTQIEVGPGRLAEVAVQLGDQAGVDIGMSDPRLVDLRVGRIAGRMTIDTALRRLLKDLPAKAVRTGPSAFRIIFTAIKQRQPKARVVRGTPRLRPKISLPVEPLATSTEPQPIIVTALKRVTSLEHVPAIVTVVEGSNFGNGPSQANGQMLVGQVLSLTSTHFGSGRDKLFVRGIADSGFSGPSQSTVGQYFGDTRLTYNAPDPDLRLHDIRSVEVLEGPQATLYGSGSMGGIVRARPSLPHMTDHSAQIVASATATQAAAPGFESQAVVNIPLVNDSASTRMVVYRAREGGYIDDGLDRERALNQTDIAGGRAALRLKAAEDWFINLTGLAQSIKGADGQYADRRMPGLGRHGNLAQPFRNRYFLGSADFQGQIGGLKLAGSVAQISHRLRETFETTRSEEAVSQFKQNNSILLTTGEFRISRTSEGGRGGLLGLALVRNVGTIRRRSGPLTDPDPATSLRNRLEEWAVFGEWSFRPVEPLLITLGGRYSRSGLNGEIPDTGALLPPEPGVEASGIVVADGLFASRTEAAFLPSASAMWSLNDNVRVFLRYQEGFRPGGLALDFGFVRKFKNDRIRATEIGIRGWRPGVDRFAFDASLAYSDWQDIQADFSDGIRFPSTANIGDGRILSVQARLFFAPLPSLRLEVGGIANASRLYETSDVIAFGTQSFDPIAIGSNLPNVADISARAGFRYRHETHAGWTIEMDGTARYVGKSILGVGDQFRLTQGGYLQTNLVVRAHKGTLSLFASMSNLFNDRTSKFAVGNPFLEIISDQYVPQRPRSLTIGIGIEL